MMQEDKSTEASSLKDQGIRMFRFGEYEEAAELFQKAHTFYKEVGDERGQAEMLNNLGAIYTQEERWDEAAEAFNKAMGAFQSLEDEVGQAQTLGNMGTMYRYQGDGDAAVEHLKKAIGLFHEAGERGKEAVTLRLLSRIRLGQARWLEALHFYDLSLACVQPPGIKERLLRRLLQIPFNLLSRPQ
jgi:tetratricopeptide (TPR) repeat protein